MEKRKTIFCRVGSMKRKKKGAVLDVDLPVPTYQLEDALLSQIQVSDVLNNCVLEDNQTSRDIGGDITEKQPSTSDTKGKRTRLYHKCYNDTILVPLWQAFNMIDRESTGYALLGRLKNLTSLLSRVFGDDLAESALQNHFLNYSQVSFPQYKRYILDKISQRPVDAEELSVTCWGYCKQHYMSSSLLDRLDSAVLPTELYESLYYLFCIFNKLSEPETYPPTMDSEEVNLFLRKLFACLGISWTSSNNESNDVNEDDEKPSQVSFHQLLSAIGNLVGIETTRTSIFYRSIRRLCLIEYQEVAKADWLNFCKKNGNSWKKRWAVLERSQLILYDTASCQVASHKIQFHSNMHVQLLPRHSAYGCCFRIADKEDLNITQEFDFSTKSLASAKSWITNLNNSIKIAETGMTYKAAEVSERRLLRHKRRESLRKRSKKQDLHELQRVKDSRRNRSQIVRRLSKQAQKRQVKMELLNKRNNIYERLEAIEFQIRLIKKEESQKQMARLLNHFDQAVEDGKILDDSCWKRSDEPKILRELETEKCQLEVELEKCLIFQELKQH